MKKREMLGRIEELERRLAEVEARPLPMLPPVFVPHIGTVHIPARPYDATITTTWKNNPGTTVTTVQAVNAWIANPQYGM